MNQIPLTHWFQLYGLEQVGLVKVIIFTGLLLNRGPYSGLAEGVNAGDYLFIIYMYV